MKKTIIIIETDTNLTIKSDCEQVIIVHKDTLTIEGTKLFDNFISKLDLTDKLEFDYIFERKSHDSNINRIVEDIKEIFNTIANKINERFELNTA